MRMRSSKDRGGIRTSTCGRKCREPARSPPATCSSTGTPTCTCTAACSRPTDGWRGAERLRAWQDPAYRRAVPDGPLKAEMAITQLPLERLSKSGILPPQSAGTISLSARLNGTALRPALSVNSSGENVTVGRLHGLAFQGELSVADKVHATLNAEAQGDVVARAEAGASLSGGEVLELLRHRDDRTVLEPLLDRAVSLNVDIPGLAIARASELAGQAKVAEGRITGRIALTGSGARPQLTGQLTMRDLSKEKSK